MGVEKQPFKVSTGLKDLIGRDLITDDFVAVFELAKNSFDAHAKHVRLIFEENRIVIADDGKGMSRLDILDKWLFVAYSAKRDGTEDQDYRDRIEERNRPYAGAKGVGRFSCDRLGARLRLSSRASSEKVQVLDIDWQLFEEDYKQEFDTVLVNLSEQAAFDECELKPGGNTGTILEITELRSEWDRDKLQTLKRELTKLIDPFVEGSPRFQIEIVAPSEAKADELDARANEGRSENSPAKLIVNGVIENPILDVIGNRTTGISVKIVDGGQFIESSLVDRGSLIYRIREKNEFSKLAEAEAKADIYFLNRSAKTVFARRMGIPAIQFGSVFLFRNGFRVFPVGKQSDDFFGINQRKQQGQRRFLGGRDLIGRVEVKGAPGFNEATSRNQGLISTPEVQELVAFVIDKCIRRLERYVVDITWKDAFDKDVSDISRIQLDNNSSLVAELVSRLAASEGVELLDYNKNIIRIVDEKSQAFEASLRALELLADETGDKDLLARVDEAKARIKALQKAEADAREAERRAESRAQAAENAAAAAEFKFSEERERNSFLVSAASLDHDTILNLHHQIMIHASDVHHNIKRMMGRIRGGAKLEESDWVDFLERISYRNSQILTAARFATKGGYKQQSAEVHADLSAYIRDYIETVTSLWAPRGIKIQVNSDNKKIIRKFKPIEIGIIIDNIVNNAVKARSAHVAFSLQAGKGVRPPLILNIADDGIGWPKSLSPLDRVFEKGTTTTDGSGLGLYHIKQVIESLGGTIEAHPSAYSDELDGAYLTVWIPG